MLMRSTQAGVGELFSPILDKRAFRIELGVGSFLTFDFGRKMRKRGKEYGEWHLWIYDCEWRLRTTEREIVNSESKKTLIRTALQTLKDLKLTSVAVDQANDISTFVFEELELICQPPAPRDDDPAEYWMFFMPNHTVLSFGPNHQIAIEPCSDEH